MRYFLLLFSFLGFSICFSQTGPGGVWDTTGTSDLVIWFKPDKGLVTSGGVTDTVLSWKNSANYSAHNVVATPGSRPVRQNLAVNGMPCLFYDGYSSMLGSPGTLNSQNFPTNSASWFCVSKAANTVQASNVFQVYPFCGNRFSSHIPWQGQAYGDMGVCCNTPARLQAASANFLSNSIWSYMRDIARGGQLFSNGAVIDNKASTSTFVAQSNSAFNIGGKDNGAGCTSSTPSSCDGFNGTISEIIIFKNRVDSAKKYVIENYLSSKYNIAITTKDMYAGDTPANGDMDFGVIGIGKESDGTQAISKSDYGLALNGNAMTSFNKGDYLFAGTNNINNVFNPYYTCDIVNTNSLNTRWERIFYIDVTKPSGNLTVDVSFIFPSTPQLGSYSLIYRTNNTPGTSWSVVSNAGVVVGNTVTFSGLNFASASDGFYTIAYNSASIVNNFGAPGGVSSGLNLWLKADAGLTGVSNVQIWNDYSGNCMYGVGVNSPSLTINASNYNPGIVFNGASNSYTATTTSSYFYLPSGFSSFNGATSFAVVKPKVTASFQRFFDFGNSAGSNNIWFGRYGSNSNQSCYEVYNASAGGQCLAGAGSLTNNKVQVVTSNQILSTNSVTIQNNALNFSTGYTQPILNVIRTKNYIGLSNWSVDAGFGGAIPEVILYNRSLTSNEQQMVNSYLGIKYGITQDRVGMNSSYLSSTGGTVFTDGGTYWNNIIGIGRDDAEALYQKQSKTEDDSVRLYRSLSLTNQLNSSVITNTLSYIVMGSDNGKLCSAYSTISELPPGIYSRINREWKIYNTNFTDSYNINIKLNSCAITGSISASDLRLLIDDDGNFINATIFASGSSGITITYDGSVITLSGLSSAVIPLNNFKYFTIGSASASSPLPIELVSFDAIYNNSTKQVDLSWQTATQLNNDYFTIERSQDAVNWSLLKKVDGAGTTTDYLTYNEKDENPFTGTGYYRLKQTDFNGTYTYSDIRDVYIGFDNEVEVKVYPNPSNGIFCLRSQNSKFNQIFIFDNLGKEVYQQEWSNYSNEKIISVKLSKGIYTIKLNTQSGIIYSKLLIE